MPELPEVEIIKHGLEKKIVGQQIKEIEVRVPKIFQGNPKEISGAKIESIERYAKMLVVNLDNDKAMLIHLKLTGQLVYKVGKSVKSKVQDGQSDFRGGHPSKGYLLPLPNKFTHVIFHFKDGGVLYFNDLRKFGYIKLYKKEEIPSLKVLKELGPDPYNKKLTPEYLMKIISRRPKIKIKQILMDQTIIGGVGNIYADESLFCARISPLRAAKDVQRTEFEKIIKCIKSVMDFSIAHGGSSENTFVNVEGEQGKMQNFFKVYRQTGEKCPECGVKIERTVVGGRGTHYCPVCQK